MTETTLESLGLVGKLSNGEPISASFANNNWVELKVNNGIVSFQFDDIDIIQSVMTQLQVEVKNRNSRDNSRPSADMLKEMHQLRDAQIDKDEAEATQKAAENFDKVEPLV